MSTTAAVFDIVIVGAGPAGLACAIEAKQSGLSCVLLDKGAVADAIRRFPTNLTFFSTAEMLEIGNIPFMASGFRPTRVDVVRYYQRVAYEYGLPVDYQARVRSLVKEGDIFRIETDSKRYEARRVVVSTGYFDTPNHFDVPGSALPKVQRYYDEPFKYHGQHVAVVGGSNSAVEIALDLFRNGAKVTLIHRGQALSDGIKYWVLPDIENRIKTGEVQALFETRVKEITPHSLRLEGRHELEIPNDAVFVMIGYRPDISLLEGAGVSIDPESAIPVHDAESMETNIKGLFVAGSIAAGKFNNNIFIENGRLHGRRIIAGISKNN